MQIVLKHVSSLLHCFIRTKLLRSVLHFPRLEGTHCWRVFLISSNLCVPRQALFSYITAVWPHEWSFLFTNKSAEVATVIASTFVQSSYACFHYFCCCCNIEHVITVHIINTEAEESNYKEQYPTFNGTYLRRYGNKPFPSIIQPTWFSYVL